MKRALTYLAVCITFLLAGIADSAAQKYPERGDIRKGNRNYDRARYEESEADYRRALEKDPTSFEAQYNLGNAMYRQGQWEGAEALFSRLKETDAPDQDRFKTHYNTGNSMFQQRKLQEALEEYKEALRIDPNDMEAKFNLAYVKKLLEKDDDGGGGGDDDNQNDQDNQDNQGGGDGNDDQDNNDNKDNNDDQQDDKGDNDDKGDGDRDGQNGERPPGMTREEAENLLEAMQMNEDKTKEKMNEEKGKVVGSPSGKNW